MMDCLMFDPMEKRKDVLMLESSENQFLLATQKIIRAKILKQELLSKKEKSILWGSAESVLQKWHLHPQRKLRFIN